VLNELLVVVVVVFSFSSAASLSLSSLSFFISNFHLIDDVWEETTRDRSYIAAVLPSIPKGNFFSGFFFFFLTVNDWRRVVEEAEYVINK
jgi:hypothetical protein